VILLALHARWILPAAVGLALLSAAELSWSVWLKPPPAGSFNAQTARAFHEHLVRPTRHSASSSPSGQADTPTFQQSTQILWRRYQQERLASRGWEYLATVVSLVSYAWALVVTLGTPAQRLSSQTGDAQPI